MRILIAEDERITRRLLQRDLERWGHDVVAVEDGAVAMQTFQQGRFDILVTDWDMPRMDGRELVQRIRADDRSGYVYVIMLTGRTDKSDLLAGMEAGADDFLAKPWDREELRVRLSAGERIIGLERRLADQNKTLQAANERMHQDLRTAAKVQQELLPTDLPELGGLRFAWSYRPCDELGGDLLNVVPIGSDAVALYLADVSGHGVAASLISVSVHRSLSVRGDRSSIILEPGDAAGHERTVPPDQVASRLNALYPMTSNGGHFITLMYIVIDIPNRKFMYCAAGQPGPVLARSGEAVRSLKSEGFPIGVIPDPDYSMDVMQLNAGDRVYLYSDGLLEAMSPDGEVFGQRRIESVIHETRHLTIENSIDQLTTAAVDWQQSAQFKDDLSILSLEVPIGYSKSAVKSD